VETDTEIQADQSSTEEQLLRLLLGQRIRTHREKRGYSLRELAEKVSLTASFLSQVERGISSPSIDSLRRISNALDVPIFRLLEEGYVSQPVVRHLKRRRLVIDSPRITYELLTPEIERKIEVFIGKTDDHGINFARRLREPTEEVILVLEGKLQVDLTDDSYILEAGDSIYFKGTSLKGLTSIGDETLVFISALTPAVF
jgi:transcriptional regulator with XRE-family HTH domain